MGKNNNWKPSVGQKVVCISQLFPLVKDWIYTVAEVHECAKCGTFHIGLLEFPKNRLDGVFPCTDCGIVIANDANHNYMGCSTRRFAPIQPPYANISKELAELAMKPVVEIDHPVKELQPQVN